MSFPVRNSVKVLLLNQKNELLLLKVDDPRTTTKEGEYHGRYWMTIGGEIEAGESPEEAALREIHEETGLAFQDITLGPLVWFGTFELALAGVPTRLNQQFLVARTSKNEIILSNLMPEEKMIVKGFDWFSLEKIKNSQEIIYPVLLPQYLPDIISGNYPENPIEIDLGRQPKQR